MDVFQGLPSNSVPLCLTSWGNQPRPQKNIVDLHKSGSSLGAISKYLKIPRSSVQTIVRKYKHHGTTQPSYRSGRRRVLSPRDERTLVRKLQINPRTTAKDLVRMLEETGTKVSMSTVKRVLYQHNLKGHSASKKPLLMTCLIFSSQQNKLIIYHTKMLAVQARGGGWGLLSAVCPLSLLPVWTCIGCDGGL